MNKLKQMLAKWMSNEIGIEFKACLYFYCMTFFYSVVRLIMGIYTLDILTLAEIVLTNYLICNIQVYFLKNFDESDKFGKNEALGTLVCTAVYTILSYILNWFDKSITVTAIFAMFVILCYICVFLVYKVKRDIDTKYLNNMLEKYKQNERGN